MVYLQNALISYCVSTQFGCLFTQGVNVSRRSGAPTVEAKGIFAGAKVERGPAWEWGNQDGVYPTFASFCPFLFLFLYVYIYLYSISIHTYISPSLSLSLISANSSSPISFYVCLYLHLAHPIQLLGFIGLISNVVLFSMHICRWCKLTSQFSHVTVICHNVEIVTCCAGVCWCLGSLGPLWLWW